MPNYIKSVGLSSAYCEPLQQIEEVAVFLLHNKDQHYFRVDASKEYFDHTLYYYLRKQKPASTTKTSVNLK